MENQNEELTKSTKKNTLSTTFDSITSKGMELEEFLMASQQQSVRAKEGELREELSKHLKNEYEMRIMNIQNEMINKKDHELKLLKEQLKIDFNNTVLKEKETIQNELTKQHENNILQITTKLNQEKEYLNNELLLSQKIKISIN